jgi:hypothetical protein
MYLQVLAELTHARDWAVHLYDDRAVDGQAVRVLGKRANDVLHGPRSTLGPPWTKDHRTHSSRRSWPAERHADPLHPSLAGPTPAVR